MTESIEVSPRQGQMPRSSGFGGGEIAMLACDRCRRPTLPWELRTYGKTSICGICYGATLELAQAAIRATADPDPSRRCTNCRAMRDPALGSAWCSAVELGDERATICANFVPLSMEAVRPRLAGSRVDVIDIWHATSEELRARLGEGSFAHWFERITPVSLEGNTLVLGTADEFTRDWLQQRLQDVVRDALAVAGYGYLSPAYVVVDEQAPVGEPDDIAQAKAGFNPHYVFSEFIVGSGNRLAHASALACVDKPGTAYNPLVLYGGVGVGKTHLLQAIGQEAIDQRRGTVLYATSETFTNELILAIRGGSTGAFRERYRSADYLLIDDIQFIAGKEATQEEFFHTFNALYEQQKQIVISSDCLPKDINSIEERLRSRFEWGLIADIQPPDLETKIAILQKKAENDRFLLPDDVAEYIARAIKSNVRELEGALTRLMAYASLTGATVSLATAQQVLRNIIASQEKRVTIDLIQKRVSEHFNLREQDLKVRSNTRAIAFPRQVAMYIVKQLTTASLPEIGRQFGGKHHTTVLHSINKIEGMRRSDKDLNRVITRLMDALQ